MVVPATEKSEDRHTKRSLLPQERKRCLCCHTGIPSAVKLARTAIALPLRSVVASVRQISWPSTLNGADNSQVKPKSTRALVVADTAAVSASHIVKAQALFLLFLSLSLSLFFHRQRIFPFSSLSSLTRLRA